MGEIADDMLSGEMCEACGTYIGCGDAGIPMYCSRECAKSRGADITQVCNHDDHI